MNATSPNRKDKGNQPPPITAFTPVLRHAMAQWHTRNAITFYRHNLPETELTFAQLCRHIDRFAGHLSGLGVAKGARVILFLEKSLIFIIAHLAVQQLGAVSVPLNPGFKKREMAYLLKDADPVLVITNPDKSDLIQTIDQKYRRLAISTRTPFQALHFSHAETARSVPHDFSPDDPALIIYTSGTTGDPKGAVLTQGNLLHDAANIIRNWDIRKTDRICHALPLFHVHGLCFALHTALLGGAQTCLLDRFDPEFVLDLLADCDVNSACTVFMAVPAMYAKMTARMASCPMKFEHVRLLASGSAPLLAQEFERIKTYFGMEPLEREGMSETGMNFSNPLKGTRKPGSIGKPLPHVSVRIVDPETLKDVTGNHIGEIWLKGPGITPGYWQKPEETRQAFKDGWFRTGDLGKIDEDGYFYLTDRIKHIIITGGENVSAKEVETVINQMDHIVESSVVGIPDEKWGEQVVAAVVTDSETSLDAGRIQSFCKEHLHDWKCPKQIRFIDEIPRNTMGKVLKESVKQLFIA